MKRNQAGRRALGLQVIPPEPKSLGPTVGYLKPVSFDELVARLGPPLVLPEPEEADGRMQVLWRLRWDDGTLNEIYDYKVGPFWLGPREGIHYTKLADWNVSGSPEGYRRLARVFGVPPRREPNPAHRRPNIAAEIIQALLPAIAIGVGLSRRPIPKPELPGAPEPEVGTAATVQADINFDILDGKKPIRIADNPKAWEAALDRLSVNTFGKTLKIDGAEVTFMESNNELEGEFEAVYQLWGDYKSSTPVDAETLRNQVARAVAAAVVEPDGKLTREQKPEHPLGTLAVHGEAPLGKLRVSFLSQVPWLEFERAANRRRALKRRLMR